MTYPTVSAITSPQLTKFRSGGQWTKLYLAVFKPNVVYSARLASLPSSFDSVVEIAFTGGVGVLADVRKDMSMYVGTTAGAYDLGVVRIRKAPIAGVFYIGEQSEVNWQTDCYLTVVDEFDLWARHLRTVDDSTFYIDYDIAYTDQNEVFDPIPVMGGHRVLKLIGVTISTQFDFSNSYVIGSTISAYSVTCPSADSITGSTTSTPTITFDTVGWHPVYLTVTAANGKVYTGIRYVYVYDSNNMPATVFQLGDCSEDYEVGGWSFTVTMQDEVSLANVPDRTLCILFAEDFYNDEQVSVGQLPGCENIVCEGKIGEEAITINAEQSEVAFRIFGYHHWFNQVNAFPTGVIQVTEEATNWAEMESPTVRKVVHRLLHWGCTATTIMDIYLPEEERIASELISPTANLWSQLQELSFATVQARVGIDRFSRMFIQVEPQLVLLADRTWATVMTITKEDWQEAVRMQRVTVSATGQVNTSGVTVDSSGVGNSLFSLSPGHVFKHYGGTEIADRLLLSTQLTSNRQAGLLLGWRNNPYPNNEFRLAANNRMIDCFPRQKLAWSVIADDSPRAFTLSGNFIPRRVEFSWDASSGFMETLVTLELESVEQLYTDGDIPGGGEGDLSDPPSAPDFPPLPDFDPIIIPSDIPDLTTFPVVVHSVLYGLLYCEDILESVPKWRAINGGLDSSRYPFITDFFTCSNGSFYAAYVRTVDQSNYLSNQFFLARASSIDKPFTIIVTEQDFRPDPIVAANWGLFGVAKNINMSEQVGYVAGRCNVNKKMYVGAGSTFTPGATIDTANVFAGGLSYGFGNWLYARNSHFSRISPDGSSVVATGSPGIDRLFIFDPHLGHIGGGSTGRTIHAKTGGSGWVIGEHNLVTVTTYTDALFVDGRGMASDPTGTLMMTGGYNGKAKSGDGGVTWTPLSTLPPGNWWFAYAGGAGSSSRWIAAGGTSLRMSLDFGATWVNVEGELIANFPLMNLNNVHVPGFS